MKVFCSKTKILSGPGAVQALEELGAKRVFLVTDPFFYENGQAARVAAAAKAEKQEIFYRVQPDPSVTLAAEGTARLRAFEPDLVIALGGGSAMDLAKAMVYFAGSSATLTAIPTTSGSGSEVTDFAILTHEGVKHPLVDPRLRPDLAILDSAFLEKLPPSLIADSGFDVICHAVEAFVAKNAGAVSDALAKEAFCTVFSQLQDSFDGNIAVRQQIHDAAAMAGMAFSQAGLGLCHALAHSLGGQFHVPHGRLNAILLPEVITTNLPGAAEKYAALADAAGLGAAAQSMALRNLKNGLIRLRRELKLPQTLAQAGIHPEKVRAHRNAIVQAALEDPCCNTNPVPVDLSMAEQVLDAVTGRG